MKTRLALLLMLAAPQSAFADTAWVQAVATGYEARLVTQGSACPVLHTAAGDTAMSERTTSSDKFPRICSAPIAIGARDISVGSTALVAPVADPQRILVLGDTGCRILGTTLQACNDPARWPFPQLAAAAAKLKPDLVIHVGDYLYREAPCPPGDAGCAGSPWGDNWITWQADLFTPAAPLMAAAPLVFVRGNHEDCKRAGPGWQRLLGPADAAAACVVHEPLFTVPLGVLTLAILDDAVSGETVLDTAMAHVYADELAGLAKIPAPVWLVHHRPTWAAITGPLGIPIGGNLSLIEASRINAFKGLPLIPPSVALQLSGHIHTFESLNYQGAVPPQIVAGNGGDKLDITPKNLRGTVFQGRSGVTVADGLSVGGFGFLLMTRAEDGWTVDLYDSDGNPTRQCRFATGRVDCPAEAKP